MQRYKAITGERYPATTAMRIGSLLDVLFDATGKHRIRCANESRERSNDWSSNVHKIDAIGCRKLDKNTLYHNWRFDKLASTDPECFL